MTGKKLQKHKKTAPVGGFGANSRGVSACAPACMPKPGGRRLPDAAIGTAGGRSRKRRRFVRSPGRDPAGERLGGFPDVAGAHRQYQIAGLQAPDELPFDVFPVGDEALVLVAFLAELLL